MEEQKKINKLACAYCKVAGTQADPNKANSWRNCPLLGNKLIHLYHCLKCDYHSTAVSNMWCTYSPKKQQKTIKKDTKK